MEAINYIDTVTLYFVETTKGNFVIEESKILDFKHSKYSNKGEIKSIVKRDFTGEEAKKYISPQNLAWADVKKRIDNIIEEEKNKASNILDNQY